MLSESEQLDQLWHLPSLISLHCLLDEGFGPELPINFTAKTLM